MLKYVNHDIVFQEFPDEVTLAINLSRCPCACPGCHSTYLWGDNGEELTLDRLRALAEHYSTTITCLSLMGGDNDPRSVLELLATIQLPSSLPEYLLVQSWLTMRLEKTEIS